MLWAICGGAQPTVISSSETILPGGNFNFGLPCPAGQSRLSPGMEGEAGDILINGMFPLDTGGILFSFKSAGAPQGTARGSLLCAEVQQRFRSKTIQVEPQRAGTVIATCPENQVVAGGGLKVTRNGVWQNEVWALTTRPWDSPEDADITPSDGWPVKSHNGTDKRVALTAYASCLRP